MKELRSYMQGCVALLHHPQPLHREFEQTARYSQPHYDWRWSHISETITWIYEGDVDVENTTWDPSAFKMTGEVSVISATDHSPMFALDCLTFFVPPIHLSFDPLSGICSASLSNLDRQTHSRSPLKVEHIKDSPSPPIFFIEACLSYFAVCCSQCLLHLSILNTLYPDGLFHVISSSRISSSTWVRTQQFGHIHTAVERAIWLQHRANLSPK